MNKFIDDKGLKRYTNNMKLLLKKKVSKKRPYGQIVIGKSINPKRMIGEQYMLFVDIHV